MSRIFQDSKLIGKKNATILRFLVQKILYFFFLLLGASVHLIKQTKTSFVKNQSPEMCDMFSSLLYFRLKTAIISNHATTKTLISLCVFAQADQRLFVALKQAIR